MKKFIYLLFISLILLSCNLSKEVDINLPIYEPQPVVECYLIPGENYKLLLTKSNSYFDPFSFEDPVKYFQSISLNGATVKIIYQEDTIQLAEELVADIPNRKIFNYSSVKKVPEDYINDFRLLIITPDGKEIHATTVIPPPVAIDSVVVQWETTGKMEARELVYVTDDTGTDDYYRRMIHQNNLDSPTVQDYVTDDKIFSSGKQAYGTAYEFKEGDLAINTHLHITRDYYLFVSSYQNSNANPFTQPGVIKSNVSGSANALGIFTGFYFRRDTTYIHH